MFSDAALAIAVDTSAKWLYNASRRLNRPLQRSFADVSWWRLTHHLAGRVGIPLADAARASDLLLLQGSELSRVRLRSTPDDAVAISVDLSRFHDGTALAAAAGLYLATPRRRGRRPRSRSTAASAPPKRAESPVADHASRLSMALASIPDTTAGGLPGSAVHVLAALSAAGVPMVLSGGIAAAVHGDASDPGALDLIADLSARHSRALSVALNSLGAVPRGVSIREGFHLDSGIVRSAPCLALRLGGVALNLSRSLLGVGEFPQVVELSVPVSVHSLSLRILSRVGLERAAAGLARAGGPA